MGKEPDERKVFGLLAVLAFAVVTALAILAIRRFDAFRPGELGGYDLAVLGLGCLRLIHLITYDKLLEPLREPLEGRRGFKGLLSDFVSCIWCTGMWSASSRPRCIFSDLGAASPSSSWRWRGLAPFFRSSHAP